MSIRERFRPSETADVVIVGGGVIGLTIARALARRGVRDLILIERGRPGAEASSAAGGILAPQVEADEADEFFRLACASRDMYEDFAADLQAETGVDVELDTNGTLYLVFTQEEESELRHRYEWQKDAGLSVEWLVAGDARRLEPCISAKVRCAIRFPKDVQVENRRLVEALAIANEKLGVRLVTDCEVYAIRIEREKVRAVETSLGLVNASTVVLAAGAWTSFIKSPDIALPQVKLEPVRGQMLCFKTPRPIAHHVIYNSCGYLVPRRDGRVLAGSTTEHVGFDRKVTSEGVSAISSMALEIAPALEHVPLIASWAGFRPRADDDLPVIGPCEGIHGLFYATGHYRNGILLAPITGELIAEAVISGTTSPLLATFSPNRFASDLRRAVARL
jgi:glycine oxidase